MSVNALMVEEGDLVLHCEWDKEAVKGFQDGGDVIVIVHHHQGPGSAVLDVLPKVPMRSAIQRGEAWRSERGRYLVVVKLHALPLQPAGAHRAEAKAAGQELQPDGGEQGRGVEGAAGPLGAARLAALLLHPRDQHHDLVQRLQPQLQERREVRWR